MNYLFSGRLITADLYNVSNKIYDIPSIEKMLTQGVKKAHATLLFIHTETLQPEGFTTFALLLESHVAIHAYPEVGSVFADVFTCGKCETEIIINAITSYFKPTEVIINEVLRGNH